MQRRILRGLALAALALPLASHADVMDYSYAELGYIDADFDADAFDADVDGDGFALRGSLAVNPNFFVFAGYQDLDFDFDVDASLLEVGGGGHWPLSDKIDIIGKLGIVKAEVDVGRFNDDDDGFLLGARVRGVVAPKFELEGGFDYRDLDIGDETTIVLDGRYFFIDQLAGGVSVAIGDDNTALGLNVRWTF